VVPPYRDAPETQIATAEGEEIMADFISQILPGVSEPARSVATNLILTTLTEVGKSFSESSPSVDQIHEYSEAMADMLSAYINNLRRRRLS
jgi:hypothetical protein